MTILSLKDKQDTLVVVPQDMAILIAPWGTPIPPKITVDNSGTLALFPGFRSAGEVQKKGGAGIMPDVKTVEIEGYGSLPSRRTLKTHEGFSVDVTFQELRDVAIKLWLDTPTAGVTVDANGEWRITKASEAHVRYYSVILIGQDGDIGSEIYTYVILPKCAVTKSDKFQFSMENDIGLGVTLTAYEDHDFGGYVSFGMAGKGYQAIAGPSGFNPSNTVQWVQVPSASTAGTFKLTNYGVTSSSIVYNPTSSALQTAFDAVMGAGNSVVAYDKISAAPTVTTSTSGGSIAAGSYYYVVTATGAFGETIISPESTVTTTTGTTSSNTVTWTNTVPNTTGYKVYRTTTSGTYTTPSLVSTIGSASTTTFVDTLATASAGAPPAVTFAFRVTYQGAYALKDVDQVKPTAISLTPSSGVVVTGEYVDGGPAAV